MIQKMDSEIVIKKIQTKADMDVCLDINKATFDPKYLTFSKYGSNGVKEILGLEIQNPFSIYNFLVAKCDDTIVGFAELREEFPSIFLNWFAVDANYQGKKIGKIFLDNIIETNRANGFNELKLNVFKSNIKALNFYKKYLLINVEEKNVCRLTSNQKGNKLIFYVVNYHQVISDKEKFGFVYIRVLFEKKIIDIVCVNDILFFPTGDNDLLNIGLNLLDKFGLKDIYFFCEKDKEVLLNYEVIDGIYTLVMNL